MFRRSLYAVPLLTALLLAATAAAQTAGTLTGSVTTGGAPLPGATITITSPALLGIRTTVSGANGDYSFAGLPPGPYRVSFELEGMQKITKQAQLQLAETTRVDVDLRVAAMTEAIVVTATAPSILETPQVSTNLDRKLVESLPVGRTIAQRIQLAAGVNNAGPNNQTVINGAQSYENLYVINGVTVNENVRGQPQNVFIEDAIQETTLLTAGVSAEYGRFMGGVVSTITKSGGNEFSGSVRDNLTNDKWTSLTDFRDPVSGNPEQAHVSKINPVYEGTFGGRIIRDRIWFFTAGRYEKRLTTNQTTATNIPYVVTANDRRYEGKLTGNITQKHSLLYDYTKTTPRTSNGSFGNIVDVASLRTSNNPVDFWAIHYNGVITNNLLLEGIVSRRDLSLIGGGALQRDLINGTMIRDISSGRRAWSPTFCGVCRPKERDSKEWLVKGSYFLPTKSIGSHNLVAGYDDWHQLRLEDNYQSGSDFRVFGDFIYSGQNVFLRVYPTSPSGTINSFIEWDPVLNPSQRSDFAVKSVFLNDRWDLNQHWSFNVGARYDKNSGQDQAHNPTVRDSRVSPRLGAMYDLFGNGRHRLSAAYSRYVAKIDQGPADSSSNAGRPASFYYAYGGPEINKPGTPTSQLLPTDQVLKQVFDWFQANGGTSSTFFDLSVPGLTEGFTHPLRSPYSDEITVGYGVQIGNGFVRADWIGRKTTDFYVIRRNLATGQAPIPNDPKNRKVDVGVIDNGTSSDGLQRKYNGLQLQGQYRVGRVNVGGNYTYSKLRGNVEGETFNNATVFVGNESYPEYVKFAQNIPIGYLNEDIRHRGNLWATSEIRLPYGSLNLGMLERYHSGQPYTAVASIDVRKSTSLPTGVVNPGYVTPPTTVNYFFSQRGQYRLDTITATDVNITYTFPLSRANMFLRADVVNLLSEQGVEFNATNVGSVIENRVYTARNSQCVQAGGSRCAPFNPFTDTPQLGVNYVFDPNFGKPTRSDAYQLPRTYRFAVGVRF
ncbi:MAG TPA: carboxypeptidase regulatory-like domain-containing protein [Thermoanaerobaculia bacterium]|nr:carboxypeptidase regulatory-like domain-containing protein [Thermoanaerobaculia bacterium]